MTDRDDPYRRLGRALADVFGLTLAETARPLQAEAEHDGIRLYGPEQVAARLDVGLTTVKALLGRELEIVHIGRSVRVPSDSLDAYIARLRGKERQHVQGEPAEPIDLGRSRQHRAAPSAAGRGRATGKGKRLQAATRSR